MLGGENDWEMAFQFHAWGRIQLELPNVVAGIRVKLSDGAWLLRQQEHHSKDDEHWLRNEQPAANPLQISERLRPTIPKRPRRENANTQPDDGQETEEARPWSAHSLPFDPASAFDDV